MSYLLLAVLMIAAWSTEAVAQHAGHDHGQKPQATPPTSPDPHAHHRQPTDPLPPFIPPVTDADRTAFRTNGVLVGRAFPPMNNYLRVSVGTEEENTRFVTAFKKVFPSTTQSNRG